MLSHKWCPHCGKELNIKTYKEHKRLYYNESTKEWLGNDSESEASTDMSLPDTADEMPSHSSQSSDDECEDLGTTGNTFFDCGLSDSDDEMECNSDSIQATAG